MARKRIRHIVLLIVLFSLFVWYTYLLASKKFSLFVHPKLHIFTYSMMVCIFLILVYMVLTIDEENPITHYSNKGLASIVFLMIGLLPALGAQLDPSILPVVDMNSLQQNNQDVQEGLSMDEISGDGGKYADKVFVIKVVEYDNDGNISMTQDTYQGTIMEIFKRSESYIGERIKTFGVVFAGREYKKNEFGVGLFQMSCCAADAQIIGMKHTTSGVLPHEGQRVEVLGTIERNNEGLLVVAAETIRPIPALKDPYLY